MMLLQKAKKILETKGFEPIGGLKDGHGTVAFGFQRDNEEYLLVAKEYAYNNLASFIKEAVELAIEYQSWLIFYEADGDEFYVFDSSTVDAYSSPSFGNSKKAAAEWRELPLEYGVSIEDHLNGYVATGPENQSTLNSFA